MKISVTPEGYLISKNEHGYMQGFHRLLKEDEVEELASETGLEARDIHVHHKNHEPTDNRSSNLQVLTKEQHAQVHGAEDWEGFQKYRRQFQ